MKTLQDFKDEVTKRETIIYNTFALAVRELRSASVARICDIAAEEYASLRASEAIREKDKWISTKDRLPDHNVSVLVFIPEENDHITTGMWDISKKWVLLDEYRVPTCQVTYWREMVGMPEDKSYEQTHSNPDEMDTVTYKIRTLQKENYAKDKEIEQLREALENIALAVKHEASDLIVRTRLNTAFEVLSKNAHTESSGNPGQFTGPVVGIDETEFNNAR